VPVHPQVQQIIDAAAAAGLAELSALSVADVRALTAALADQRAADAPVLAETRNLLIPGPAGDIPARLYRPAHAGRGLFLYFHGGGWVIGSVEASDGPCRYLADTAGVAILSIDYRLAPEHPFPAALEDAVAAYEWLLARGIAPERIVVAGDSAGGGLTVATLLALRDRQLPRPGAGVCISPWVDLTCSGATYVTKAAVDPIVARESVTMMAQAYAGAGDPKGSLLSPLYADLRGLPPLLVQVGSDEVLLDDALGLGERARAAGVDVTVREWPAMIHVWHWFLPMLAEAERAVDDIGTFVRARLG